MPGANISTQRGEMPAYVSVPAGYHEPSAVDARRRILAFFHGHLSQAPE